MGEIIDLRQKKTKTEENNDNWKLEKNWNREKNREAVPSPTPYKITHSKRCRVWLSNYLLFDTILPYTFSDQR